MRTYKSSKGFTIVEMLVSVTILTIAIGAPLYLATQGVALSLESKNRLTAVFLAEEAIEYMKHKRDSNILEMLDNIANGQPPQVNGEKWDRYINSTGDCTVNISTEGCFVDIYTDTIRKCGVGGASWGGYSIHSCPFIGQGMVGAEKRYGYDSSYTPTIFVRVVSTWRVCPGSPGGACDPIDNIEIKATVFWREQDGTGGPQYKSVTVSDYLFESLPL